MRTSAKWSVLAVLFCVLFGVTAEAKERYRCRCGVSPKGKNAFSETFTVCAMRNETAQIGANRQCEAKYGFSKTGTFDACKCRFKDCVNTKRHCGD